MKFGALKDGMEGTVECAVLSIEEGTIKSGEKKGQPFLSLSVSDGESVEGVKMFGAGANDISFAAGDVIFLSVKAGIWNGAISFTSNKGGVAPSSSDISAFILSAPIQPEKMFDELMLLAKHCGIYAALTKKLLLENKNRLMTWGAAKSIHHNIRGGLMYHLLCVARMSLVWANELNRRPSVCGNVRPINTELLVAGAILHDIGKVRELDTNELGGSEYTPEGILLGHIYMSAEMVTLAAEGMDIDPEKLMLLKHVILAHHGKLEYGSPVVPGLPEAEILHEADMADSRMYQMFEADKKTEEGKLSERIFGIGTPVYHPAGFFQPKKAQADDEKEKETENGKKRETAA